MDTLEELRRRNEDLKRKIKARNEVEAEFKKRNEERTRLIRENKMLRKGNSETARKLAYVSKTIGKPTLKIAKKAGKGFYNKLINLANNLEDMERRERAASIRKTKYSKTKLRRK